MTFNSDNCASSDSCVRDTGINRSSEGTNHVSTWILRVSYINHIVEGVTQGL